MLSGPSASPLKGEGRANEHGSASYLKTVGYFPSGSIIHVGQKTSARPSLIGSFGASALQLPVRLSRRFDVMIKTSLINGLEFCIVLVQPFS